MIYRDYEITSDPTCGCCIYVHLDYDGPEDGRVGEGTSIEDCKRQIDEIIENSCPACERYVCICGRAA